MSQTARLTLSGYDIAAEDDGLFGDGVDLYLGWIVQSKALKFTGVSPVRGGLKTGVKNLNDHLFDLSIPANQIAAVHLYMYESDESTAQVAQAFQQLNVPDLHDYYIPVSQPIEVGINAIMGNAMSAVFGAAELLKKIYEGGHFNTDDAYGQWSYILNAKSNNTIEFVRSSFSFFGKKYLVAEKGILPTILTPKFVDNDNNIKIRINAQIAQ